MRFSAGAVEVREGQAVSEALARCSAAVTRPAGSGYLATTPDATDDGSAGVAGARRS